MNRRDFVSKGVRAVVASSQAGHQLLAAAPANTDEKWLLSSDTMRAGLNSGGSIRSLEVKHEGTWEQVEFCRGPFAGPAWADAKLQSVAGSRTSFAGTADGIRYSLRYALEGGRLAIMAGMKNERASAYTPKAARLVLGINCEMLSYPTWNDRYFPTLLRCEKTHFWGYFMTPRGRILTIGSPDPVASYTLNYEKSSWGDGGHLINTCSLDLMHALPLPARHPQHLVSLKAGEMRTWTIYLQPLGSLDEIKPALAASLSAPMIEADRYTLAAGENSRLTVWAKQPVTMTVVAEDGSRTRLPLHSEVNHTHTAIFTPQAGPWALQVDRRST